MNSFIRRSAVEVPTSGQSADPDRIPLASFPFFVCMVFHVFPRWMDRYHNRSISGVTIAAGEDEHSRLKIPPLNGLS
jgi:hypothetical protein